MEQVDQIYKLCSVLGTPTMNTWAEGLELAMKLKVAFPQVMPRLRGEGREGFECIISNLSSSLFPLQCESLSAVCSRLHCWNSRLISEAIGNIAVHGCSAMECLCKL